MRASLTNVAFASPRSLRFYDALITFWVIFWLVIGAWTGLRLWQFAEIGDSVADSGRAAQGTGAAIRELDGIPLIGGPARDLGERVEQTGARVTREGEMNASRARQTALLLGIVVAIAPSVPVAGMYIVLRRAHRREARALQEAFETEPGVVDPVLALRAVLVQSHQQLSDVVPRPYTRLQEGDLRALADAELARIGLRRLPLSSTRETAGGR